MEDAELGPAVGGQALPGRRRGAFGGGCGAPPASAAGALLARWVEDEEDKAFRFFLVFFFSRAPWRFRCYGAREAQVEKK